MKLIQILRIFLLFTHISSSCEIGSSPGSSAEDWGKREFNEDEVFIGEVCYLIENLDTHDIYCSPES